MFVSGLTMLQSCSSVLLRLLMLTKRVVMSGLMVMMCGGVMMSGRLVMVFASGVRCR